MNVLFELIMLAIVVSLIEQYSQYSAKRFAQNRCVTQYAMALFGYTLVILIVSYLSTKIKIGIVNCVWSAVSICAGIAMGYLAFGETVTRHEAIGAMLAIVSIIIVKS